MYQKKFFFDFPTVHSIASQFEGLSISAEGDSVLMRTEELDLFTDSIVDMEAFEVFDELAWDVYEKN